MSSLANVTVVLPAFNEEASVGTVVRALRASADACEIVVVDDGSTDRTCEVARDAGATVIRHAYNLGLGASLKTGIRHASRDHVVIMDADGQHQARDVEALVAYLDAYDMVVAARPRHSMTSGLRAVGAGLLSLVASLLTGRAIPDLTSGFRAFRRKTLALYVHLLPNRYSSATTLTLAFLLGGHTVKYVPMPTVGQRSGGVSKLRPLRDGLRVLLTIVRIVGLFGPLRVFLPAGGLLVVGGAASALCKAGTPPPHATPWALFVGGVVVIFFGLLADRSAYRRRSAPDESTKPQGQLLRHDQ